MTVRRVLLTGASGFIGRAAVAPLLARGFEVHAASRRPLPGAEGVMSHAVDLLDPAAAAPLVAAVRPSHLLHLAWDVTPGRYWQAPENLDWVAATVRLYRAFATCGGRRMLGVGSCAEYDWSGGQLDEATTPERPDSLYGVAKHALHQMLARAAALDGVAFAWGRVFFLYGPHEAVSRLVPSVVVPLLRGREALVGDGVAERDFMHVADVAAGLVAVLDSEHLGAVNVASGVCRPVRDVVMAIAEQVGRPELVRFGAIPARAGEPRRLAASGAVLGGLGFAPRFGLEAGLADTVAWWAGKDATTATICPTGAIGSRLGSGPTNHLPRLGVG